MLSTPYVSDYIDIQFDYDKYQVNFKYVLYVYRRPTYTYHKEL
jgi:hypothetical protein